MENKENQIKHLARIREIAEEKAKDMTLHIENVSEEDTKRLLHELQVHQIELEMQNEELRQSQLALDDSREKYFDLYNLAPVGYVSVNEKGIITEANLTSANLLGIERRKLINTGFTKYIFKDDQDILYINQSKLKDTGFKQQFEIRMLKNKDQVFWADVEIVESKSASGEFSTLIAFNDLTINKNFLKTSLEESNQRLKYHFENSPLAVIEWDKDYRVTHWSKEAEHIFGWTRKETIGLHIYSLNIIFGDDIHILDNTLERLSGGKEMTVISAFRSYTKSGEIISCIWYNSVLTGKNGKMTSVMSLIEDITEKKKFEQSLQQTEENLRIILNATHEGIFMLDKAGMVLEVNLAGTEIIDKTRNQILGKEYVSLIPRELATKRKTQISKVINTGKPINFKENYDGKVLDYHLFPVIVNKSVVSIALYIKDITERWVSEKELKESEKRFEQLAEASFEGIAIHDNGRIVDVNKTLTEFIGYTKQELIGRNIIDFIPQEYIKSVQGKLTKPYEIEIINRENEKIPVEIIAKTLKKDGKEMGVGAIRDLREKKKAEMALLEQKNILQLFVKNAPAAMAMFDTDMKYLVYSDRWLADYNLKDKNITGCSHYEIFPEISEEWKQIHKRCLAGASEKNDDDKFVREDGSIQWLKWAVYPWYTGNNEIGGIIIFTEDITKKKYAEDALRESEEKYKELIKNARGLIFNQDTEGRFIFVNEYALEFFGFTLEELIGKTALETVTPPIDSTGRDLKEMADNIYKNPDKYSVNINENIKKNGESVWIEWHNKAIFDKNGNRIGHLATGFDITERKKAEDEIKSLARFPKENPNPVLRVATDGTILYANTGAQAMLELLYWKTCDPLPNVLMEQFKEFIHRQPAEIKYKEFDMQVGERVYSFVISTVKGQTDMNLFGRDITEREKAENELIKSRQEWIDTFNKIPDLIALIDNEHRIVRANKAMLDKLGVSNEDAIGVHCYECVHGASSPPEFCPHAMTIKDGKEHIVELFEERLGGDYLVSTTPMFDNEGKLYGSIHVARDISERKHAEKELQASKDKLNLALDNADIGIWEFDLLTNKIILDERIEKMLGLEAGAYRRMNLKSGIEKYIYEEDIPHVEAAFKKTLEKNLPLETVLRIKTVSNKIKYFNVKALLEKDSNGKPFRLSGVCFDITEMKEGTEKTLFNLNAELLRSNKELQQFAYVASHDLQEPLRMISSYTQLLERKYKDKLDQDGIDFINYAVEGSGRMYQIINDLLKYSRVNTQMQPFKSISMNAVTTETFELLTQSVRDKGAIINVGTLPTINADKNQMVQLMQNLVSNALKFCKVDPVINIGCKENENEWEFSVKDNGIGIDTKQFERIFLIFQRLHTRTEYPGSGIGLAICKRIVERHGGRIWVESEEGKGTTFFFTINKKN